MKLLENLSFESLGEALSTEDCIDGRIDAKLESYRCLAILSLALKALILVKNHKNHMNLFSCKLTSEDKKFLGRSVTKRGASPHDLAALSPPTTSVPNTAHRTRTWSTR